MGRSPVAGRVSAVETLELLWIRLRLSERPVTSLVTSAKRTLFLRGDPPSVGVASK